MPRCGPLKHYVLPVSLEHVDFPMPVGPEITTIGILSKLASEIFLSISCIMDILNLMS